MKLSIKPAPYHITVILALFISAVFYVIDIKISIIVLIIFAAVIISAPFLAGTGFFLPVISRGIPGKNAVALTFDDGPDPDMTPLLLKLLSEYSVKATFFVTGKNASRYPDLIKAIIKEGHSIGNHSLNHDPLLMLKSKKKLYSEIESAQKIIERFGIRTYIFRPPAGITNPRLNKALKRLDLTCVNWTCRAFDAGNRRINGLAGKILKKTKPGSIILLHDANPGVIDIQKWINEMKVLLQGLGKAKIPIIPLSELAGIKTMEIN